MTVWPGDLIHASVTVVGHRVTLALSDRIRRRSFAKIVSVSAIDDTSAEWILEAPSECFANNQCRTLPLADFGSAHFADASAQSTAGSWGTISSRLWGSTKITLAPSGGRTFVLYGTAGTAIPTALQQGGAVFQVTYSQTVVSSGPPLFSARASAAATGSVQPGGGRR